MRVYSLAEAIDWFLNNATGSLICVRGGDEQVCHTADEAKEFYKNDSYRRPESTQREDDSDDTSLIGMAIGAGMSSMFSSGDDSPSMPDTTPDVTPAFESGGGDFGGAGAGSEY